MQIEPVENPTPEKLFNVVDRNLEGENYHSMIGVPKQVFEAIKPFLASGSELPAAHALADIGWMR